MKFRLSFALLLMASLSLGAQTINVASFNIRLRTNADYKHADGWDQRRDILCDMIRFSSFDAFGAQEVTYPQLTDMLDRLPDYDYVGVGRDDGKNGGEFSPVFYNKNRFKLLSSGTFWLSETPDEVSKGWDGACRRVCSYAQLRDRRSGRKFWFFNTHLDHVGKIARKEGVKLILAKIHEIAGDKARVVVTGDFNVDQFSDPYKEILSTGRLQDCAMTAKAIFSPGGSFSGWNPALYSEKHIDHIFVSSGSEVDRFGVLTFYYWEGTGNTAATVLSEAPAELKMVPRTIHTLSDHFPITATVRF